MVSPKNESLNAAPVSRRIPAWRRIGLKLVQESDQQAELSRKGYLDEFENFKDDETASNHEIPPAFSLEPSPPSKKRKFVRFSEGTIFENERYSENRETTQSPFFGNANRYELVDESTSIFPNQSRMPQTDHKQTYLEYLTQFHTDRSSWRFKKSAQTCILKHVFDIHKIPEEYDDALHGYLQGLQGSEARKRLVERTHQILSVTMDEYNDEDGEIRAKMARSQALKRQLLEEKVRMREEDDEHELETEEFQRKAAKRRRALRIAAWIEELWATRKVPEDLVFEDEKIEAPAELGGPINSVFSVVASKPEISNGRVRELKKKRIIVRVKKARTGLVEDDIESVSSVSSNDIAELLDEKKVSNDEDNSSSSSLSSEDTSDESDSDDESESSDEENEEYEDESE